MNSRRFWIIAVILFFLAGAAGSYFFMRSSFRQGKLFSSANGKGGTESMDFSVLRIYQPRNDRLEMTERKIPKRISNTGIAEAVIEEFFKQTYTEGAPAMPKNVKLLGLYKDESQMFYIDLSDEVRRNFQGDALSEYLLLKGLYESLVSNVQDLQDVKVLIEGKEAETLGGHFFLKYPLKNTFSSEPRGDGKSEDE